MMRIVLTGGPGAGKTVVARAIAESETARCALVPEAATQVYATLGTRWDRLDDAGRRDAQRRIYRTQRRQEDAAAAAHPGKVLLLDRGTPDGATYWPEGPDDYWRELGTTLAEELARYDAVIWLQTAAALGLYDGDASNAVRFETADAAVASGEALAALWSAHPVVTKVPAFRDVRDKVAAVRRAVDSLTASRAR